MGEATAARAVGLRVFLTAGLRWGSAAGASGGYVLFGCQNGTGDRVLPGSGSSVMKQKAQATVLVALPCFDQRLTGSGLGCVCGAGHEDTPHLPARECHVLLRGDLRRGNTM